MAFEIRRRSELRAPNARDRVMADLGKNLFNSAALPPALSRTEEVMKHKWVRTTPEYETTKFSLQPIISSSFSLDPQNDEYLLQLQKRQSSDERASLQFEPFGLDNGYRDAAVLADRTKNTDRAT